MIFALPAYGTLAQAIAERLGLPLGQATIGAFADGEARIRLEADVAGQDVYLVGSTGPPVDSSCMALALLVDAARRACARSITAITPYLGYSRGDHLAEPGTPIPCRLVADLLQAAGLDRLIAVDLHSPAIPGFFTIPVAAASAVDLLASAFPPAPGRVVVAPDGGAIKRASRFATLLGADLAVAMKHRPAPDSPKLLRFLGEVEGREALIVDDMVSTGGTLEQVIRILRERGAQAIDLAVTHPVMAPGADERLRALGIRRMIVTDSLPYRPRVEWRALEVVSLAPILADLARPG